MKIDDFVQKRNIKNIATSNVKLQQVLSLLNLISVGIYLGEDGLSSVIGIVKIHPSKGTHWVCYINKHFLIQMVVLLLRNYLSFF